VTRAPAPSSGRAIGVVPRFDYVRDVLPRAFGDYVLERALSQGGMGDVHLAVARDGGGRCVVKTIRVEFLEEDEFVGRFADEAKIMRRVDHPNIIRVFDAGRVRSEYYIAMEHVHGADLGDVLDRAYERGHRLAPAIGLYIASELLAGLAHVHGLDDEHGRPMGLVHRDVSPQNVLLGFDGRVKLIDFGLARSALLPARTLGGLPVGKYGYMSPEQARHEALDGRADVYAAGVTLFEVFTGARLVDEEERATLFERVLDPRHRPPSAEVPGLPSDIDAIVVRATQARADNRFPSAAAMRRAVEAARATQRAGAPELARLLRRLYRAEERTLPPAPRAARRPAHRTADRAPVAAPVRPVADDEEETVTLAEPPPRRTPDPPRVPPPPEPPSAAPSPAPRRSVPPSLPERPLDRRATDLETAPSLETAAPRRVAGLAFLVSILTFALTTLLLWMGRG